MWATCKCTSTLRFCFSFFVEIDRCPWEYLFFAHFWDIIFCRLSCQLCQSIVVVSGKLWNTSHFWCRRVYVEAAHFSIYQRKICWNMLLFTRRYCGWVHKGAVSTFVTKLIFWYRLIAWTFSRLSTKCGILIRYRNKEKWLYWSSSSKSIMSMSLFQEGFKSHLIPCLRYFFMTCNIEYLLPVIWRKCLFSLHHCKIL